MTDDRDPRSVQARLENASTQLEHALERADEENMDRIIDAIAATDAALAKETGETPHQLRTDGGERDGAHPKQYPYPSLAGRLQTTLDRLDRTQRQIREDGVDEEIDELVTEAAAATDRALALARGDDGAIKDAMEAQ